MAKTSTGPRIHRIAYFWPGLPQLWMRGSWAGLLVAVGFTALANVLLLASLVFGEWIPLETQLIGYGALTVVWLLARWQTRAERRANLAVADEHDEADGSTTELSQGVPEQREVLFREAQGHYLRNDWVATEQLLLKLLKQDSRDVESRLMLATLWRHQGRGREARRQLDRLSRLEAAEPWQHEIAAERMAIEAADENSENSENPDILAFDADGKQGQRLQLDDEQPHAENITDDNITDDNHTTDDNTTDDDEQSNQPHAA